MAATYSYDPSKLRDADGKLVYGLDLMRFQLGDVMTEGGAETCALCDEEYLAMIPPSVTRERTWLEAKLSCIESIFHRFGYEPDTKVGPLDLKFGARAQLWKDMYDQLKKEVANKSIDPSAVLKLTQNPDTGAITPPYFYNGMMSHEEAEGQDI